MIRKAFAMSGVLVVMVAFVAGCSEKLTYERWQTLTTQSPKTEVETVLGEPYQQSDNRWVYHNSDKQITCDVDFGPGDKVMYSRWVDPKHGTHEIGTNEIEKGNLIQREIHRTDIKKR